MNRNIELKTRYPDLERAKRICLEIGAIEQPPLLQTDTYFAVPHGRLKLREMPDRAELIEYTREDKTATRASDYRIAAITDPANLKAILASALGIKVEVRKRREWFLWHNVRIHLDTVDDLGTFIEFEAVLSGNETEAQGH